ncbi:MAG: ATP-binding cassette domain-containing protein [Rhizobiaceae bacterium]|nr:ATP-binding cassette domain-containing protein [Rhizobiaceae bacterium]
MRPAGDARPLRLFVAEKTFHPANAAPLTALRDLSIEIKQGEFVCLYGPSGCGKTTILRIMLGLDTDFAGTLSLPETARTGVVFQEPTLLPWRTVEENVRLAMPSASRGNSLDTLFSAMGLEQLRNLYPNELSLGLARRAALARAFAIDPTFLFLDEPFASLDSNTAQQLRELLLSMWSQRSLTVLMVTHDLDEALMLSDRIIVLSPRPARVIGSFEIETPRKQRDAAEITALRRSFSDRF